MPKLALNGGTPVRTSGTPGWPVFDERDEKELLAVLRSGSWGLPGNRGQEFEKRFAAFQDAKRAITCCNGTVAIEIALLACGIGAGDEVIVTPYSFMATPVSIVKANAIPIFVDIDPETCNISPAAIESAITPRTKGIVIVHVGGCPCDMDAILAIARKHNLRVIEDCAHAHGAEWNGVKVGAIGDIGTFSFQSSKNLTCGEGGAIVSNDEELAATADAIHNCGRAPGRGWYEHFQIAANYRLGEFQAALLLAGLERLPEQIALRKRNGAILNEQLAKIPGVVPQKLGPRVTTHSYHIYIVRFPREFREGVSREKLLEALRAEGFPCSGGYGPLYKLEIFSGAKFGPHGCPITCPYHDGEPVDYSKIFLPEAEKAVEEIVWLYQTVLLGSEKDMMDLTEAVAKVMSNLDELRAS